MRDFFFRPEDAWVGDAIPFHSDGEFRLFYHHDWRNEAPFSPGWLGCPFYQISTVDFVDFTEHGEFVPRGAKDEQDATCGTGSVIAAGGIYHVFYTGINYEFRKQGKPEQAVMHAVSKDLLKCEKIPEDMFYAPTDEYEPHPWGDPFVFWNEEAGEYWMLLTARIRKGPPRRRGCIALCASKDLKKWDVREPFWAPSLYYRHECPDLFKIGEWWYLVYSTFTERFVTHYRMSRSLRGPWLAPENDAFDGAAFYAAKTWSDGRRRFVFGWNPTKYRERDYNRNVWGGNLVVHEIVQEPDGSLSVRVPETIDRAFSVDLPSVFSPGLGEWKIGENVLWASAPDSFAGAVAQEMPGRCRISARVTFSENTRGCGIMLRTSEDLENAYYIRLEPGRNRLVFDSWPVESTLWAQDLPVPPDLPPRRGDCPFRVELERPIDLIPGEPYELRVFVDGTVCEVYAGEKVAMSTRLYDIKDGKWGVFVKEGTASFDDVKMSIPDH